MDFGAGSGLLLHELRGRFPAADLIGVEPYMQSSYPGSARYIRDLAELEPGSADLIGAFEVCEHLYEPELQEFLSQSARALGAGGRLIVSIPITLGAAAVAKKLNYMLFRGDRDFRFKKTLRAAFGLAADRPPNPRITHEGFDFRWLRGLVSDKFAIERTYVSPFPRLPWYLNSQVFYVCRHLGSKPSN